MNESDVRSLGGQLWEHLYRAAALETNMELVSERVLAASGQLRTTMNFMTWRMPVGFCRIE